MEFVIVAMRVSCKHVWLLWRHNGLDYAIMRWGFVIGEMIGSMPRRPGEMIDNGKRKSNYSSIEYQHN